MKKTFLSLCAVLGMALASQAVEITTSCGTVYEVTCDSCTTGDFVGIALELDAEDCG